MNLARSPILTSYDEWPLLIPFALLNCGWCVISSPTRHMLNKQEWLPRARNGAYLPLQETSSYISTWVTLESE